MSTASHRLTIIGDIGVDLVMGPISGWPRIGTETLVDRNELRAGGSAANAALAVSYLGGKSRLVSVVGNDEFGSWLAEQLQGVGAELEVCDCATTLSVGLIHACGERNFFTTRGHLEQLTHARLRAHLLPASHRNSMALLSGVFLMPGLRASYLSLIQELGALGYQVALDTNWPPYDWNDGLRAEVGSWISHCEHVLLNELEVASLANVGDLDVAADRLMRQLKPGATLIIKTGARGAVGYQNGVRFESAAPHASIFDTIGAGDSFNAGYLLARLDGAALPEALAAGCRAATAIIARFPRRPVRPGELAHVLAPLHGAIGARA